MPRGTADIATETGPDFRHVDAWLFDLDNTLYSASSALMQQHEERICLFVQRHLALPRDEAWTIQKAYLRDYGTTLSGLMKHHSVDPDPFIEFVNDVDISSIDPAPALAHGLARLKGRRLIFTNNCGRFASRVLERLGVTHLFDDIVDSRSLAFRFKPDRRTYEAALARSGALPERVAMVDDALKNLEPAHALGITTVWHNESGTPAEKPGYIHHETRDLASFLSTIRI
jgi:putative hydrolase of the HAD superfamily